MNIWDKKIKKIQTPGRGRLSIIRLITVRYSLSVCRYPSCLRLTKITVSLLSYFVLSQPIVNISVMVWWWSTDWLPCYQPAKLISILNIQTWKLITLFQYNTCVCINGKETSTADLASCSSNNKYLSQTLR